MLINIKVLRMMFEPQEFFIMYKKGEIALYPASISNCFRSMLMHIGAAGLAKVKTSLRKLLLQTLQMPQTDKNF
jgi:hypothetical protein